MWSADVHPPVLRSLAGGAGEAADAFELDRLPTGCRLIEGGPCEHLLITDGLRVIRLDVVAGTLTRGPVVLNYLLSGLASAERPLLTLRRLVAYCRNGKFSRQLHPPPARARRWILALRAHDALASGAGQREIAEVLLGTAARQPRWRTEAPSLRSQAQRLVRGARRMAAGYRELLR